MWLAITQADIDNGVPRDDARCPFALACARAKVSRLSWCYPQVLREFTQRFDAGLSVEPITFRYWPYDGALHWWTATT